MTDVTSIDVAAEMAEATADCAMFFVCPPPR